MVLMVYVDIDVIVVDSFGLIGDMVGVDFVIKNVDWGVVLFVRCDVVNFGSSERGECEENGRESEYFDGWMIWYL